ncbi:MAG: ABC transporter ATP-binding protein/permease [Candidatus Ancillula sp.]|jgi:ATP-binding cassette subfamily B protein|nr:ABC transporter ATP-binding protein/permease [Candidatus Ancillula sp.]
MLRIWKKFLLPYWKKVLLVVVLQAVQVSFTLYLPNMNAHIIDDGVAKGDTNFIWREGSMMLLFSGLQLVVSILATYFGAKVAFLMSKDVRKALFYKVQDFSAREMSSFGAPTLITRTTNDITQVQMVTMFMLTLIIASPIMFVGGIIMSLEQDVVLSGVIAATLPVILIVMVAFVLKATPYFKRMQKKTDRMNEVLREQIMGVRVVRAFTREKTERSKFLKVNDDFYNLTLSTGRLMSLLFPAFMLIINVSILAIMWFGGIRVSNGEMEIGAITAFITYMMYIMMSVLMSSMIFMFLPRAQVSAKRISAVLKTKITVENKKETRHIENPRGVVTFESVEFRYSGATEPVLSNISFTAMPGKTTAIIGSTGSGKSSLIRLIPRLFDATGGTVKFDGVDVRELDIDELNSYISIIPQKSFLFSGTLADNLRFGKADATEEEMWEALEIAQSAQFVRDKANEEHTDDGEEFNPLNIQVAQGGTNFSGGQRQRLAIARAIIRKPKVFQFDDSFSALDYATDHNLRGALKNITQESTVIIVAQRISTIRHADLILVMDNGQIVGQGTHEELLEACETYREIVNSQLSAEEVMK